jgi:hypothetical protein
MITPERRQELLKDEEIQKLIEFYIHHSVMVAVNLAAQIADSNRGLLQVGDIIRQQFGLPIEKEKK